MQCELDIYKVDNMNVVKIHNFKNYRLLYSKHNSGNYRTLTSIILELHRVFTGMIQEQLVAIKIIKINDMQ